MSKPKVCPEGRKNIDSCWWDKKTGKHLSHSKTDPDWTRKCMVCNATPIMPETEMCGPCTFGEAETVHGNW